MWFKNLKVYRLTDQWHYDATSLEAILSAFQFTVGNFKNNKNVGWVPFEKEGTLVHHVNGQYFLKFCSETKLLPASVVRQVANTKAEEIEEKQGFKPGRKQMREIREEVEFSLRTQAFSIFHYISVWIDPINHWLVIDAGTNAKADAVIGLLAESLSSVPIELIQFERSPTSKMTEWLLGKCPDAFSIDDNAELTAINEASAKIRYVGRVMEPKQLKDILESGKCCTRLALTWRERVSFILTEDGDIKRVSPIDLEINDETMSNEEIDDANLSLMAAELARLFEDLYSELTN